MLVLRVAGQSNPSKSVRVRRQAFLGQGRLTIFSLAISFDFQTLVPSSHLIFRFWCLRLIWFCSLAHMVNRSAGNLWCGTTLRIIWQKRNLTTWKKCVKPKKVCGEISWIGHLVGFLLAHFSFDVYIIQTPWNIILPMWEVYMLLSKTLCSAIWKTRNLGMTYLWGVINFCLCIIGRCADFCSPV